MVTLNVSRRLGKWWLLEVGHLLQAIAHTVSSAGAQQQVASPRQFVCPQRRDSSSQLARGMNGVANRARAVLVRRRQRRGVVSRPGAVALGHHREEERQPMPRDGRRGSSRLMRPGRRSLVVPSFTRAHRQHRRRMICFSTSRCPWALCLGRCWWSSLSRRQRRPCFSCHRLQM